MHYHTCNKLIEKTRILMRELGDIKYTLEREQATEALASCDEVQEALEKLKTKIVKSRTE